MGRPAFFRCGFSGEILISERIKTKAQALYLALYATGGTMLGAMNELSSYHQAGSADSLPLRFLPFFGAATVFLLSAFTVVAFDIGWWALLLSAALLTLVKSVGVAKHTVWVAVFRKN